MSAKSSKKAHYLLAQEVVPNQASPDVNRDNRSTANDSSNSEKLRTELSIQLIHDIEARKIRKDAKKDSGKEKIQILTLENARIRNYLIFIVSIVYILSQTSIISILQNMSTKIFFSS